MQRRKFLKTAGVGAAATTVAAPALAQGMPELKWRLTSSFPKSLDTLFGGAEHFCRRVGEITDGKFKITPFASGEIVPGFQVLDAVQNGTVEMGQTAAYYYIGKDITFTFDTAVPFGLNSRQHVAWWMHGGGRQAMDEFYKDYGVVGHMMGGTGAQMGGWYRKEIKTVDDLKGLKFRVGGFAGQILGKLGVVAQQIPGGDIYPALEKGTIDAAEWVGPYDDEKLGFNKVAPFYAYPGWWEGGPLTDLFVNQKAYDALTPEYKAIVACAASMAQQNMLAKYDALNPAALKRLVAGGAKLFKFPKDVMDLAFKESMALYNELSDKNPAWKKMYADYSEFRRNGNLWFRFAEAAFDDYMQAAKL